MLNLKKKLRHSLALPTHLPIKHMTWMMPKPHNIYRILAAVFPNNFFPLLLVCLLPLTTAQCSHDNTPRTSGTLRVLPANQAGHPWRWTHAGLKSKGGLQKLVGRVQNILVVPHPPYTHFTSLIKDMSPPRCQSGLNSLYCMARPTPPTPHRIHIFIKNTTFNILEYSLYFCIRDVDTVISLTCPPRPFGWGELGIPARECNIKALCPSPFRPRWSRPLASKQAGSGVLATTE